MPFKLISFLFFLIVAAFFIGFNLENRCDISFVFYTFTDVPIILSLLGAYVVGAFSVLPFLFGRRKKDSSAMREPKKRDHKEKEKPKKEPPKPVV